MFSADSMTWSQLCSGVFISRCSTDCLHTSFGLPQALFPPGVRRMATLRMDVGGILQTQPFHLHLKHLTSREMGCMHACSLQNSRETLLLK